MTQASVEWVTESSVEIDYSLGIIADAALDTPPPEVSAGVNELVEIFDGGMFLLSAAQTHTASLRLEYWTSAPPVESPPDAPGDWTYAGNFRLALPTGRLTARGVVSGGGHELAQLDGGTDAYGVQVWVRGREAVVLAFDDAGDAPWPPEGLEVWTLQFWPS